MVEGMETEEEEVEYDEHVWLSLRNVRTLAQANADTFAEVDPDNADVYQSNAAAYIEQLTALDARYADMVAEAVGCSAETEASFETVVFLAQKVDELDLPAVLTIEGVDHRIAETVVGNTATKDQKILKMDSLQGKPADGATHLSVMENA